MKKYFIIFDAHPHKVDWNQLYNPSAHELILLLIPQDIVLPPSYATLEKQGQIPYFSQIIRLNSLSYESLKNEISTIISNLEKLGVLKEQIEIIGDGELCLLKAARLRETFKLKGPKPDQVIHFRNKIITKLKLDENGLKSHLPKYMPFEIERYKNAPTDYLELIIKKIGLPIFAKPIDLVSSLNISKIENRARLEEWCENNKNNPFMELDEFIEGEPYHCDSIVRNGEIKRVDISKKINPSADFLNGKPNGSFTLPRNDLLWDKIYSFNKMILKFLAPPDGCTDLDLFVTNDGRFIFIECAARTPAEFIPEMYESSTGINYYLAHYKLQMGYEINPLATRNIPCAWVVIPPKKGILKEVYVPNNLSSKFTIKWKNKPGDLLKDPKNLIKYVCLIELENNNYHDLELDIKKINNFQFYSVEPINQKKDSIDQNSELEIQTYVRNLLDG